MRGPRIPAAFLVLAALPGPAAPQQPTPSGPTAVLQGTVRDALTGQPVRLAVVRIAAAGASALTDDGGHFRFDLAEGEWRLVIRRIGYAEASLAATARGDSTRTDVLLQPLPVALAAVTVTPAEDPARDIIARAIAHKSDVLAKVHDYRYRAYVKFVARDLAKPRDSASSIVLITETRTAAYWEHPDHYQETIVARRQSSNLDPADNLVSVGEIVNFNRNRIDLRKYSIVSPIADDALDHYDYRMLDTLVEDGRRVFRLDIAPKSETSPLFVGIIDVADSTYDVVQVDVGVNAAARFNYIRNVRYQQRLKDVGSGRWMPDEIRLSGEVHLAFSLPGYPGRLSFEHVALLGDYGFDQGGRPADVGEYRIVVGEQADRRDSTTWATRAIPLTDAERAAWARIDSAEHRPASAGVRVEQGIAGAVWLGVHPDFFHFNRVDGAYVGASREWRLAPEWVVATKLGYGFGNRVWQYRVGADVRLSETRQLWVGWSYRDETMRWRTLISNAYNPTVRALLARLDPLDYYRERGLTLSLSTKLFDFTRLDLQYNDAKQSNLPVTTDYTIVSVSRLQLPNPPIVEGHLRSFSGSLSYDSRPLLKDKGVDYRLRTITSTRITIGAEIAAPDLVPNDFSFRRYTVQVETRQRTLNLGLTTLTVAGGIATRWAPPQRYFNVDFGMQTGTFQSNGFNTLADTNYSGNRAAMLTVRHDFDRLLFVKSGLPLVRNFPFTLSLHGGAFWTDFIDHTPYPADVQLMTARKLYTELGFGLGNLTPFLSPFNLAVHFTWQLSSYRTHHFRFGLGLSRP